MKLKIFSFATMFAMSVMAFTSTASAATLEIEGVAQTGKVFLTASLKTSTSAVLKDTEGSYANTCTTSHFGGETEKNFTTSPTGALNTLTFENCTGPVTVHAPGALEVTAAGGTNGNVYSEGAQITVRLANSLWTASPVLQPNLAP